MQRMAINKEDNRIRKSSIPESVHSNLLKETFSGSGETVKP